MPDSKLSEVLGDWEGYQVAATTRSPGSVEIELTPIPGHPGVCSGCQQRVAAVHDYESRRVRDLPILDQSTILVLARRRLACPQCGPKLEHLNWLAPYARVTNRLAENVALLCAVLPIKHVAQHYGLGWDTVKELDKAYLQRTLGPVQLQGVTQLVMDEFALRRGHRYATVIVDALTKRVLWVGKGRRREDIRPFFQLLGRTGCEAIEAVAMDMNGAYEPEVRQHCPQARIVYDLFHVVAKYGREVIDRVRVDEANRLRADRPARAVGERVTVAAAAQSAEHPQARGSGQAAGTAASQRVDRYGLHPARRSEASVGVSPCGECATVLGAMVRAGAG